MSVLETIFATLRRRGGEMYGGEVVTQLGHALQSTVLARGEGAPDALVTAALLHDYGHLLADDEGQAEQGRDMFHEDVAADHLARWFGPAVTEPIRLHVAAKRYLCAVDPDYAATLSPASVASLAVQGGPFNDAETAAFRSNPHWQAAVRLRFWDDLAKDPELQTPDLSIFRPVVAASLRLHAGRS